MSGLDRSVFDRVLVVHNGKGGTFKTAIAGNVAGTIAKGGQQVLLIDMDPQANLGVELGYQHRSDGGESLADSLERGTPLEQLIEVRENLFVAQGGPSLGRFVGSGGAHDRLALALDSVVDRFDLIIIDTPPSGQPLVDASLGVAHHLLIPTTPDRKSLNGLGMVAQAVERTRQWNPHIGLLGVVLVGVAVNATQIRATAKADIASILGGEDYLLDATIRTSQKAAMTANARGLLASELADQETSDPTPFYEHLRAGRKVPARLDAAPGLAVDYAHLTNELITRLNTLEDEDQQV